MSRISKFVSELIVLISGCRTRIDDLSGQVSGLEKDVSEMKRLVRQIHKMSLTQINRKGGGN